MSNEIPLARPGQAEENADKFREQLILAQNIADPIRAQKVPAREVQQMGCTILVATCPRCGTVAGLTGEGKHLCRHCHLWMQYVKDERGRK